MLILSRRVGETILIGENVRVTVLSISGRHVKIGTDAPKEVPVHRQEVFERDKEQKK
tara:strand:- start:1126 stop:1296 length:171 start_codon:yes stop_codon:yes gene_type:complete